MSSTKNQNPSRLLFTGDTVLRPSRWKDPACSSRLVKYIEGSDLAMTNLEAPVRSQKTAEKFGPNLSITPTEIESISDLGFDAVSLANNHIRDFGSEGVEKTIKECREADLQAFGAGRTKPQALKPLEATVSGLEIGVIGICEHEESVASESASGAAWAYDPELVSRLNDLASDYDLTFLVAHGGLEYIPIPPASWRSHLRTLAETDLDAVIAHHPHTPQGWERHHGTPIFYSLGNFLMNNSQRPSTQWSYGIEVTVNACGIESFTPSLFSVNNSVLDMMEVDEESKYERYLDKSSTTIQNDAEFPKYWSDVAHRLFSEPGYRYQYRDRLKEFGTGHIYSLLSNPILEIDRLTRGVIGSRSEREKELALLDLVRVRSHRDAIQTVLEPETSDFTDQQSEDIKNELDELFTYSDGTINKGFIRKQSERTTKVLERLFQD